MRIAIVGFGIAGHTFASSILKALDHVEVDAFSDEPSSPFYRTRVLSLLDGKTGIEDLEVKPRITDERFHLYNLHVDNIDSRTKTLYTSDRQMRSYDVIVLANGAKAASLPLPGSRSRGIFTIRTASDVEELSSWLDKHRQKPVAVIGGGLLGLEAASLVSSFTGEPVTVLESAQYILPRQLDRDSSLYLQKRLAENGIRVLCSASTSNFLSVQGEVSGIKCDDGFLVPASTVIESVGIRSNTFLAVDAGLETGRGVVVDEHLKTSCDDIYAIGDAAQTGGIVQGLASAAMDMARTLASILSGKDVSYRVATPSSMLKIAGLDVMTFGRLDERGCEVVTRESDAWREAFFIKDGTLAGASLIGDRKHASLLRSSIGKPWSEVEKAL